MGRPKKSHLGNTSNDRGRERVWWNGRYHDLGPAGSDAARAEYARLAALWAADPAAAALPRGETTCLDLFADFLASADAPAAKTRQRERYGRACGLLGEHHLETAAAAFGPVDLRAWQAWLCGLANGGGGPRFNRTSIAEHVWAVRSVWKWAVSTGRLAETNHRALLTVPPPKAGECREPVEVPPAEPESVAACLPFLRPQPRAMVAVQSLTGARPTEVCRLTPGDLIRGGKVRVPGVGRIDLDAGGYRGLWLYAPAAHKTAKKGKTRLIFFGPAAQRVLAPFLDRPDAAYCFSPAEALADLRREQAAERAARNGGAGGNRKVAAAAPKRKPGACYTYKSYGEAVERACLKAGVVPFAPYQLRHLAAEEIAEVFGEDAAGAVLGHSQRKTTARYTKNRGSARAAAEVAKRRE